MGGELIAISDEQIFNSFDGNFISVPITTEYGVFYENLIKLI